MKFLPGKDKELPSSLAEKESVPVSTNTAGTTLFKAIESTPPHEGDSDSFKTSSQIDYNSASFRTCSDHGHERDAYATFSAADSWLETLRRNEKSVSTIDFGESKCIGNDEFSINDNEEAEFETEECDSCTSSDQRITERGNRTTGSHHCTTDDEDCNLSKSTSEEEEIFN